LLGVAILITLATNMAWVASEVHVSKYLPKNKKGELMGVFITGKDIGFDLAPLFYGLFAVFGLKVPFIILGILLLCGWIFFRIAWRKN
jgi:sugar phosphate permease